MTTLLFNGPWQAIMGMAAIRSNFHGNADVKYVICLQRDNEQDFFSVCRKYFNTRDIDVILLSYNDYMRGNMTSHLKQSLLTCDSFYLPHIVNCLKLKNWTMINSKNLYFYEDGLHSYSVIQKLYKQTAKPDLCGQPKHRKILSADFIRKMLNRKSGNTVKTFKDYTLYWSLLNFPNMSERSNSINITYLLEEIAIFREANQVNEAFELFPTDGTVVLGTNFSMYGMLSADYEYDPVIQFIENFQGNRPLFWKPHPRASRLYTEYLTTKFPLLKLWPASNTAIPFECYLTENSELNLVSVMSTSLLYGTRLWGMNAQLIGDIEKPLTEKGQDLIESYRYLRSAL